MARSQDGPEPALDNLFEGIVDTFLSILASLAAAICLGCAVLAKLADDFWTSAPATSCPAGGGPDSGGGPEAVARRRAKRILGGLAALFVVVLATLIHDAYWPQFALVWALVGWMLFVYWEFGSGVTRYLQNNIGQALLLLTFLMMIWGCLFIGVGVPDLIWHEDWRLRLISAISASLLLSLFGVIAYHLLSVGPRAIKTQVLSQLYHGFVVNQDFADWLAPTRGNTPAIQINPLHYFLWLSRPSAR
jgi:hypothetical protein